MLPLDNEFGLGLLRKAFNTKRLPQFLVIPKLSLNIAKKLNRLPFSI